jgi:uncharacterized protein YjbJ (UPF0337 family)
MDDEAELIRGQMQDTREALTEKLEALEQQVVGTVQSAAGSVAETVGTVTDSVQETVENVKESVEDAVTSVKESLNLRLQVERHPWTMFFGAIAVGYVGTRWLENCVPSAGIVESVASSASAGHSRGDGADAPSARSNQGPSFLEKLAIDFRSELDGLKGLAVSAAAGLVRDIIADSIPAALAPRVSEWMDDVTHKIGGKPIAGPLLRTEETREKDLPASEWEPEVPPVPPGPRSAGQATGNGGHGGFGRERRF